MDEIEKRARQIYADQFPGDCGYETREWIMEGKHGDAETIQAIICALTPKEGFVLVPVDPTDAMLDSPSDVEVGCPTWAGSQYCCNRSEARDIWGAMIAARPEIPNE